jgi:sterol desaturase/sphingolipid hydroxylase (fatty acid hydroxylase superfamily)
MKINVLAFAVPLFTSLMLLEYFIAKKKRLSYFNLHNSIANLSIGIAERLCDVLVTASFYYIYDTIQKKYGLFHIKQSLWLWILLLLCTDFLWYWYHRLAHEINLFWAVHVVHHQSEDYNYTVSARITVLQAFVRTLFWAVLPLLGFPASMITVMLLIHGIYPFFIHTRLIGKLGILEYILVTPSHHRVHHASNEKYLDKNYGDVFIIWDKLFGTFQKEEEEPVYGLTEPLNSYSFLWQHFHYLVEIAIAVKAAKTLKEKIKIVFGRPAKFDEGARKKAEAFFHIHHVKKTAITKPLNRYVIWQIIALLVFLFLFILFEAYATTLFKIVFTGITILTLINCGAIMERKRWIFHVELLRLGCLFIIPFYYNFYLQSYPASGVLLLLPVFVMLFYQSIEKKYLLLVYKNLNCLSDDV